jgi:hypothetical protein
LYPVHGLPPPGEPSQPEKASVSNVEFIAVRSVKKAA